MSSQAGLQVTEYVLSGVDADIGRHKQRLEVFKHCFVNLAAWCEFGQIVA